VDDLRSWAVVVVATHSDVLAELADVRVLIDHGQVVSARRQVAVLQEPDPRKASGSTTRSGLKARGPAPDAEPYRLGELVRAAGAGRRLLGAALLSAAATLAGLGLTACSMWLISRAAQHPNVQALAVAVVGVRTFAIGRAGLRYLERLTTHDTALRMLTSLRVQVFEALRPLPPALLARYGRGDLLRRFVGDVDGAQEGLVRAMVPTAGALAGAAGAVGIAAWLDPRAGLVLGLGLFAAALVIVGAYRSAGRATAAVTAAGERDRLGATLLESLGELVAFGAAGNLLAQVRSADRRVLAAGRRAARASAVATTLSGLLTAASLVGVLLAAAAAVDAGRLPVVQVGVLAVCVLAGFEAVNTLPAAFVAWTRCRAGLVRVAEVTGRGSDLSDPRRGAQVAAAPTGLAAWRIAVGPEPGSPDVIEDLTLTLEPGDRIAVVGPSGCGKSTLLAAMLRQLPVRYGSLAVTTPGQEVELSDIATQDVPPLVAGSLQGDHVFDTSLRDNLLFVRPAATDADLDEVAHRVGMYEVVHALPQGWSTPAGPDGAALSGGQRQRLLLARALLFDPRVLVLDEPTAHLDHVTEQLVLADLLDATAGRTVLMSTHRHLAPGRVDRVEHLAELCQPTPAR
jgi:thiol reductant ABC exporter CydC subunit